MSDSLLFAQASTPARDFDGGTFVGTGALSAVFIAKPTATALDAVDHYLVSFNTLGSLTGGLLVEVGSLSYWSGTGSASVGPTVPAANEWYLFAATKATGTSTPRFHMYRYSTSTWTHSNGDIANASTDDVVANNRIGHRAGTGYWDGNILIGGCWDSQLADLAVEGLAFNKPAWVTAAPKEAWRLDTAGSFPPFVGTSTYGTAVDCSLDAGDAPSAWVDVITAAQQLDVHHVPGAGLW
jgi:hypothetical protein